jgi:hypothetical protein
MDQVGLPEPVGPDERVAAALAQRNEAVAGDTFLNEIRD